MLDGIDLRDAQRGGDARRSAGRRSRWSPRRRGLPSTRCIPVGRQVAPAVAAPRRPVAGRRPEARHRNARAGRHSASRASRPAICPSALGRHVPARDDCDGARDLAAAADRRRADDRARCLDRRRASSTCCASSGQKTGAAILLITHDLGVVAQTCHRVAVMHAGQVVEGAPVRRSSTLPPIPIHARSCVRFPRSTARSRWSRSPAAVPSLLNAPPGCRYAGRCAWVEDRCRPKSPA